MKLHRRRRTFKLESTKRLKSIIHQKAGGKLHYYPLLRFLNSYLPLLVLLYVVFFTDFFFSFLFSSTTTSALPDKDISAANCYIFVSRLQLLLMSSPCVISLYISGCCCFYLWVCVCVVVVVVVVWGDCRSQTNKQKLHVCKQGTGARAHYGHIDRKIFGQV